MTFVLKPALIIIRLMVIFFNSITKGFNMKKLAVFLGILLLTLSLAGCGGSNLFEDVADDSSSEAKEFDAIRALDEGDYDKVIAYYLGKSSLDPKQQVYLASAYLGKVNVDFINLIEVADSDLETFDIIASIFGADEVLAAATPVTGKVRAKAALTIEQYEEAILTAFNVLDETSTDKDVRTMKGVLGAMDITILVAKTVMDVADEDSLTLSEEGIRTALNGAAVTESDVINNASEEQTSLAANTRINRNLTAIADAIAVFSSIKGGDTSDIKEDFEDFLNDLDHDNNQVYDAGDIADYINFVIVGVV